MSDIRQFTDPIQGDLQRLSGQVFGSSSQRSSRFSIGGSDRSKYKGIKIKVVLYDPLAGAGLYDEWEQANASEVEKTEEDWDTYIKANAVNWRLLEYSDLFQGSMGDVADGSIEDFPELANGATDSDGKINFAEGDDVERDKEYVLEFPDLNYVTPKAHKDADENRADMLYLTAEAKGPYPVALMQGDAGDRPDKPAARKRFRLKAPGEYTIRIWLRPRTVVLHWTVGNYQPNHQRSYHFHVSGPLGDDEDIKWMPCGEPAEKSWRFWWHNLRIEGIGNLEREVETGQVIPLEISKELFSRGTSYSGSEGSNKGGCIVHAQHFHTNSAAVTYCSMAGVPDNNNQFRPRGAHSDANLMTESQILFGLKKVADLCNAWGIEPTDPNQLCTHWEVDKLHHGTERKWDITWLPVEMQDTYAGRFNDKELCEEGDKETPDERRYKCYADVPLGSWRSDHWSGDIDDITHTDRVGNYLRTLVSDYMDS